MRPPHPEDTIKVGVSAFMGVSQIQCTVPVVVTNGGEHFPLRALLDSRAAGVFIDLTLAKQLRIPL